MRIRSSKLTILIVEDDPSLREVICLSLERYGYYIFSASQGQQAFEILRSASENGIENQIDLVVSDIKMPGGNGLDLLRQIKTELAQPPVVILMTGFSDTLTSEAIKEGAHAILSKPFTVDALVEEIEKIYPKPHLESV